MSNQRYQLATTRILDWPKLGWAARIRSDSTVVEVFHGPCVETAPQWCAEAVWAGDFSTGDFDLTDLITGTGVRLRGQGVLFVSSGDNMNRLHYHRDDDALCVSNSLALLLATAKISLRPDYDYAAAMHSIVDGVDDYQRRIPSTGEPIHIAYFRNLLVTPAGMAELSKPSLAPDFHDFAGYRDHLFATARAYGANAASAGRAHPITPMATLSKGYDSPAAAVLAREAGATSGFTVTHGRRMSDELIDTDDSGESIGSQLGLRVQCYPRFRRNYPSEDASWSSDGNIGDVYLSVFDYPEPLCLLFTGFNGDVLWGTEPSQGLLRHRSTSGTRFNECRLELGVFNCAPPLWGGRKREKILAVSRLPEMARWTLGTRYDRPIPRRIVEEAGGRRGTFATRKRVASFNRRFGRPLSEDLREDFARFMRRRGGAARSGLAEKTSLLLKGLDSRIFRKLPKPLRFSAREWITLPEPLSFFLWANERRTRRYQDALERVTRLADPAAVRVGTEPVAAVGGR